MKYLYYIAKLNIRDYVNEGNAYVKYITNKLNEINKDKKLSNIQNYDEVFYRIFKITEIDNVANLTRLLFNVLTSFDAFLSNCDLIPVALQKLPDIVLSQSFFRPLNPCP